MIVFTPFETGTMARFVTLCLALIFDRCIFAFGFVPGLQGLLRTFVNLS